MLERAACKGGSFYTLMTQVHPFYPGFSISVAQNAACKPFPLPKNCFFAIRILNSHLT